MPANGHPATPASESARPTKNSDAEAKTESALGVRQNGGLSTSSARVTP
jgi:hypothetical protein